MISTLGCFYFAWCDFTFNKKPYNVFIKTE